MDGWRIKAARELIGEDQTQLARNAGVSRATLRNIENDRGDPKRSSINAVVEYLRSRGIKFVDDVGVVGLPPPRE